MKKEMTDRERKLVEENMGLVGAFIARNINWSNTFSTVYDRDDLYQAGCVGLIKAAMSFDPDRGTAFSTYAYKAIRTSICRLLNDSIEKRNHEDVVDDVPIEHRSNDFEIAELRADIEMASERTDDVGGIDIFELFRLYNEGYSCAELGRIYNRSRYWISVLIHRAEKEIAG